MGGNILSNQKPETRNQNLVSVLWFLVSVIRYRFFLFAGTLPYLLGQTMAFNAKGSLNWNYFWYGFFGICLVLAGVEFFNEYFDAKDGGDRIFSPEPLRIPRFFFPLGNLVFFLAFLIGLYLTLQVGWPILLFSFLGCLGAYFYVGPPLRWAYRGLGELVIALSYGPFMILGSYYLQTGGFSILPFFVSTICGLAIFYIALLNEIPDFYQDRLVGKRNLVVRLGKEKSLKLLFSSLSCVFLLLGLGIALKKAPIAALVVFLALPMTLKNLVIAEKDYENPNAFIRAINTGVATYLLIMLSLGLGYIKG